MSPRKAGAFPMPGCHGSHLALDGLRLPGRGAAQGTALVPEFFVNCDCVRPRAQDQLARPDPPSRDARPPELGIDADAKWPASHVG